MAWSEEPFPIQQYLPVLPQSPVHQRDRPLDTQSTRQHQRNAPVVRTNIWDNQRETLTIPTISRVLKDLDNIINEGAALGKDVYNPAIMGGYNRLSVRRWWRCSIENHFFDFLNMFPR
jgi:hypothetical protein